MSKNFKLDSKLLLKMYDLMVKTRALEERLIKMYKQNDGFFWIGGPGEESFSVPLGLLLNKGEGPKYDYFHGHYRSAGVLLAMGADPQDSIRQMKNTALDPYSGGRNFCGHQSIRKWNVAPISSPIEVQYAMAPGTAMANKRSGKGVTVVVGGDAGTAEGDFASCLVWSSRPVNPLPILITVTNNKWGISTAADSQHGETKIADRARAFNIPAKVINGLDPVETYIELQAAFEYIRKERKPCFIEARVSRLYGHSSASGANYVTDEEDPIKTFEKKLLKEKLITQKDIQKKAEDYNAMMLKFAQDARSEPQPEPHTIWDNIYADQKGKTGRFW